MLYIASFLIASTFYVFVIFEIASDIYFKSPSVDDDAFVKSLELLKTKYPNQNNEFWTNIIICYQHSIKNKKDPSIILIASDSSTR